MISRLARAAVATTVITLSLVQPARANGAVPLSRISPCWNQAGSNADHQWVPYSTFIGRQGRFDLFLDEYTPSRAGGGGPFPAAVLVHGGGWVGGCRTWMDDLAVRLAVEGFIVFNIDYRLACADPSVYLCGFLHPASILDVQTAIRWVRENAGNYSPFTGRVAAVGTSAGGNLVYMAGDTGVTGDTKPDAMAGASGQPEMGYLSDLRPACEEAFLPFIGECWADSTAYFGLPLDRTPDWCGDGGGDTWSTGSPACNVDPSNLPPPTFITNATEELSAYQGTLDFRAQLDGRVSNRLCTVSGIHSHDHGTGLLIPGEPCDEEPGTDVLSNMVAFLKTYL